MSEFWPVKNLDAASIAASPNRLDPEIYVSLLKPAWADLIASESAKDERLIQDFMENHPCMIPGSFGVDGESGHGPWPSAVITQPKLPGVSERFPDFMWISTDSESVYPILVEIETPDKKWWRENGEVSHSDFTQAQGQLAEWRAWFSQPLNQQLFLDMYDIPGMLRRRRLQPRFVLVIGRRSESNRDEARQKKRGFLARDDERIMTFDRIEAKSKASRFPCVTHSDLGYAIKRVPPTFDASYINGDVCAGFMGWENGVNASPYISKDRAKLILREINEIKRKGQLGIEYS